MRLRDYQVYHATFEPCIVQGNSEGFKAVIHTVDMDIITYGVDFDNTVKMSQAVVTDMAHAMSFEEMIPAALPVSKVNVPDSFMHGTKADENKPSPQLLYCSADINQHLKDLFKNSDTPSVTYNLADPSYVSVHGDSDDGSTKAPTITVPIELPLETAYKIVIANEIMQHSIDFSKLSKQLGWRKSDLENKLDFYTDTNIFDLKLIASNLHIEIDEDEGLQNLKVIQQFIA